MKALFAITLTALTLSSVPSQARSLMPARPVLELMTDDAEPRGVRPGPTSFRFPSMKITLLSDASLLVQSERLGEAHVKLAQETFNSLINYSAILSEAKLDEKRYSALCAAIASDYRDSLKVARGLNLEGGVAGNPFVRPGALRAVWAQSGCYYGHELSPVGNFAKEAIQPLVLVLRTLAIEGLDKSDAI